MTAASGRRVEAMGFILKDRPFALKSAEPSAAIPDAYWLRKYHPAGDLRLFWSLEVWAEGELDGVACSPRAPVEEMRFPVRRWADVVGQTVEWEGPYDEKAGVPSGSSYLDEHGRIGRARLRFTERDGAAFRFEWEGACDVLRGEEYDRDVPFPAAVWARLTGGTVYGSGADPGESVRGRLALYLDPRDFVQGALPQGPHRYHSGVRMSRAVFTPSGATAA